MLKLLFQLRQGDQDLDWGNGSADEEKNIAVELKCINEQVNVEDEEEGQIYFLIPGLGGWLDNGANI